MGRYRRRRFCDCQHRHPRSRQSPKRVAVLVSNPAVSPVTGWPVGFWWAELVHPYWELSEHGYEVDVYSPDGGALVADAWSDPRDESGYSAEDILSLGFIASPKHAALVEQSSPLADLDPAAYDAVFLVGGQAPMITFINHSHACTSSFATSTRRGR